MKGIAKGIHVAAGLVVLLGGGPAFADFVGLDQNADYICEPGEMGFVLGAGDQGQVFDFDIFFDDLPPIIAWGCHVCVQDKNLIENMGFVYSMPEGWLDVVIHDNETHGEATVPVSQWIKDAYPDFRCYQVQSTDFSFSNPIAVYPYRLGTFSFTYTAAEDGCVGFLHDGSNTAYMTTGFISAVFEDPGETCDPYECGGATGTESSSWGETKHLFR